MKKMKVAILAGGMGSRLAEETQLKPKPMVEIGGRPILWHIMSHYATYGHENFVVALGYKGEHIKRYICDFGLSESYITVDIASGDVLRRGNRRPHWTVELVDTGHDTNTGGR